MQPYNADTKCSKCGSDNVNSTFCKEPLSHKICGGWGKKKVTTEHIHRNCLRCRFEWLEGTIASADEEGQSDEC